MLQKRTTIISTLHNPHPQGSPFRGARRYPLYPRQTPAPSNSPSGATQGLFPVKKSPFKDENWIAFSNERVSPRY